MDTIYPGAHRNLAPANLWGPAQRAAKGVLHTTESRGGFQPGASYFGHSFYPHFTVSRGEVWQHIPTDRAARAMRNLPGGVETNNAGVVQIENNGQVLAVEGTDATKAPWVDGDLIRDFGTPGRIPWPRQAAPGHLYFDGAQIWRLDPPGFGAVGSGAF